MRTLWQDLRYGIRTLAKNLSFTVIAIITLALGIGVNTAIFSMVDTFVLNPLPVKDPGQITVLAYVQKHSDVQNQFSIADYRDIRSQTSDTFSDVFGYQFGLDGLEVNGNASRIATNYVTGNFFSALGIQPAIGSFILPSQGETPGVDPVLVLGYSYWKSHFASDPSVVDRKVSLDGHPVTIIGVAPKSFHGVYPILDVQGYLPLGMASLESPPSDFMTNRRVRNLAVLARLRPNVTLAQAQATLKVIGQRLSQSYPNDDKDLSLQIYPELRARPQPDPNDTLGVVSALFLGLSILVLLLACVNVANILLVRATAREREMAIRSALGAGRGRLIRQLLAESVLLAIFGGIAGVVLGVWGSKAIASIDVQVALPVYFGFGFDWRVFVYATAAALLTGIIVGIVPAVRASRGNLNAILHDGGRSVAGSRNRLGSALVVAQVAGSLMLLIIAGLFTRSLGNAQRTDLGFDPSNVANFSMDPNEIGYSNAQTVQFYKNLLDRVRFLPGIESASTASSLPMGYYNNFDSLDIQSYQPPPGQPVPAMGYTVVSPDFFKTMRIPLLHGRAFSEADNEKSSFVAIITDAAAKKYWPNVNPIGQQLRMLSDRAHLIQIVGVTKDVRYNGITGPFRPYLFIPYAQHSVANSLETLQVRTTVPPETIIPEIQRVIESATPSLPVFDVRTMTQGIDTLNGLLMYRLGAGFAAALGVLGLILAVVGVYGVVSYSAGQRTHEIGIRLALGAQPEDILKLIFRQGFVIIGLGVGIGLLAAAAVDRVVGNFLSGVSPTDPLTYLSVSLILALVALAACYTPARRAMRTDPMVALRYE